MNLHQALKEDEKKSALKFPDTNRNFLLMVGEDELRTL